MDKKRRIIKLFLVIFISIAATIVIHRVRCIEKNYNENLKLSKIEYKLFGNTIFTEYTNKNGKTILTSNKYGVYVMEAGSGQGYVFSYNKKSEKMNYINAENGQVLAEYEYIYDFDNDGYAYVKNAEGKYGCIYKDGKTIIEPKYNNIFHFYDDRAYVELDENGNRKYGFINWNDEWIMEVDQSISDDNDLIAVKDQNGLYGYMDISGKYKIAPQFTEVKNGDLNIFVGRDKDIVKDTNGKWGMIDNTGKYVIESKYMELYYGNYGYMLYKDNTGLYGYLDENGDEKIEAKYISAESFDGEGFAKVQEKDGKWHFIEAENRDKTPNVHLTYKDDMARVRNEQGLYGYIDRAGNYIINPQYLYAYATFEEDMSLVQNDDGKWGTINKEGKYVIEPKYVEQFDYSHKDKIKVKSEDGYYYIDKKENVLLDLTEYDEVINLSDIIVAYNKTDGGNKKGNVCKVYNYEDLKECSFEVNNSENYIDINVHVSEDENKHVYLVTYSE